MTEPNFTNFKLALSDLSYKPKGYDEFYREGQLQFDRERGEKLNNKKIRATRVSGLSYKDCLAMDLFICFTEKVNCSLQ